MTPEPQPPTQADPVTEAIEAALDFFRCSHRDKYEPNPCRQYLTAIAEAAREEERKAMPCYRGRNLAEPEFNRCAELAVYYALQPPLCPTCKARQPVEVTEGSA